ncbi:glycosyl transferase, group 1 family domain protein [Rhodopirellula maiorica SM1]|uniref:Glycosyl transferase, group 1 family domain protein n=1 Tax=Rhodopirellula maiorica SM1 TaxID=1265738 RepID=M5RH58_9BACT|nr:glycosyltransferase family 4 protein [Rhodopirellula maiorica]EMI18496.1 glycosyl transferase, group 1 family domain protein [Rhodopirellula maiorica SM1]
MIPHSTHSKPAVLFVDQTAQLGGAELCLLDIVRRRQNRADRVLLFQDGPFVQRLRDCDVDVSVFTLGAGGSSIRKSSGLFRKLASSLDVMRLARNVASAAESVDVIYANTAKALVVSTIAGWISRKPVIYHLHDILAPEHFSRSNLSLLVFLATRFSTHVIANSNASKASLVQRGGDDRKITVVYNGIDASPFQSAIQNEANVRSSIRQSIGLTSVVACPAAEPADANPSDNQDRSVLPVAIGGIRDTPVVALFGRFSPWKGQHVAIQALRQLPGVHLMLVGDALFDEHDYVAQLHQMADEPELQGRVHFMGFRSDVAELMQTTDIVIHCSTAAEPFGRVIVEAMMSRRPIIATRGGGASEIVRNGENGWLVTPGSESELVAAIRTILNGNVDVSEIVARASCEASERFELEGRVAEINAVIEKVVNV